MQQERIQEKKLTYVSIYEQLYDMLADGTFPVGSALPSEPKLAAMLGISRMTLRQALELLHEDGLLNKIRGKGNFVTSRDKPIVSSLERLGHPVYKCIQTPVEDVEMDFRLEPPNEHEQGLFKRRTAVAVAVDRWYRSGGRLVAYSLSLMPIETVSRLKIDLNHKEQLLEQLETGIYATAFDAHIKIQATRVGDFISEKYKLSESGELALIWENLFEKDDFAPLVCNKHYILPDCCSLEVHATR